MEHKHKIAAIAVSMGVVLMLWDSVYTKWQDYQFDRNMAKILSESPNNGGFWVFPKDATRKWDTTASSSTKNSNSTQWGALPSRENRSPTVTPQQAQGILVETKESYKSLLQWRFAEAKRIPTSKEPPNPESGMVWHTDAGDFSYRDTGVWLLIGGDTWYKYDPNGTVAWNATDPLRGCKYGAYLPSGTLGTKSDVVGCQ